MVTNNKGLSKQALLVVYLEYNGILACKEDISNNIIELLTLITKGS